jgi:hypothetical protein
MSDIDKGNLLPPIQVLHILCHKGNTTVAVIRDYINKKFDAISKSAQEVCLVSLSLSLSQSFCEIGVTRHRTCGRRSSFLKRRRRSEAR